MDGMPHSLTDTRRVARGLSGHARTGTMGGVSGRTIIHWMNAGGAACGAPQGAFVSPYPHAVNCEQCVISLKIDVLHRRLAAHRASVQFGLGPRVDRGKLR